MLSLVTSENSIFGVWVCGALHGGSGDHHEKEAAVGPRVTFSELCYNVAHEDDDGSGTTYPYLAIGA
jgi:hypothetical protein